MGTDSLEGSDGDELHRYEISECLSLLKHYLVILVWEVSLILGTHNTI